MTEQHLGPAQDQALFARLVHAVEASGGNILPVYTGMAGSHSIVVHEIVIGEDLLTLRSETGAGLVISGPREPVEMLARLVGGRTTLW